MRFIYVFVAVSSLFVGTRGDCSNNPNFLFDHEGKDFSCADLGLGSKDLLCKDPSIARACAESCDSCSNKNQTKISSASAAAATSKPHHPIHDRKVTLSRSLKSIACAKDDPSYHLPWEPDHDCLWVKSTEAFRQHYCQSEIVKSKCPIACGECCEDDSVFTFTVNEVGVNAPVSSPSKGNLAGSSNGKPTNSSPVKTKVNASVSAPSKRNPAGQSKRNTTNSSTVNATHQQVEKNCEWLHEKDNAEKYCETETFKGRKVQDGKNDSHRH